MLKQVHRVSNMKEIAAPKPKEYSTWPLAGRPGKVFAYNVFYRSKRGQIPNSAMVRSCSHVPQVTCRF